MCKEYARAIALREVMGSGEGLRGLQYVKKSDTACGFTITGSGTTPASPSPLTRIAGQTTITSSGRITVSLLMADLEWITKTLRVEIAPAKGRSIMNRPYVSREVSQLVDLPARKLISYHERGFIQASMYDAGKYGARRLYSFADILKISMVKSYEAAGFSVSFMRKLAKWWDDHVDPIKDLTFAFDSQGVIPRGRLRHETEKILSGERIGSLSIFMLAGNRRVLIRDIAERIG